MPEYKISLLPKQRIFLESVAEEEILGGAYGCGKSLALCYKIVFLLNRYPRSRGLLLRKTLEALKKTTLKTLLTGDGDVPPALPQFMIKNHNKQDRLITLYNDSELYYTNMDIESIKSFNLSFVGIDEATEFTEEEWNACKGRLRLANVPIRQIFGVTNPSNKQHWIYNRFMVNPPKNITSLMIHTNTYENKYLPREYIRNLENSLFGHYYKRYVLGEWVGSDSTVYDNFDHTKHIIPNFEIPRTWKRYRSFDFGYRAPFSCCWFAVAEDDMPKHKIQKDDIILYREVYYSERTTTVNAQRVQEFSVYPDGTKEQYVANISDWDSGDRADLEANGIFTIKAKKDILVGIQKVRERLGNSDPTRGFIARPRFFIFENTLAEHDPKIRMNMATGEKNNNPTCAKEEFMTYSWKPNREEPEDDFNHSLDAIQYFVTYLDGQQQWKDIDFKKL